MKNKLLQQHVNGFQLINSYPFESSSSKGLLTGPTTNYHIQSHRSEQSIKFKQKSRVGSSLMVGMSKLGERADSLAHGIREHVKLGPKITATVKGKLSLGAKIIQVGGVKKVFKKNFSIREGETLLKASQCYLSTTIGPIAGLIFISTDKIAFCSERSIKLSSPTGDSIRIHYKVLIPLRKIKRANESENVEKPSRKYLEIVTLDNFDFWFMGFVNYQKTFKCLQQAMSQVQLIDDNSEE